MPRPATGDDIVAPSRPRPLLAAAGKQAPLAITGGVAAGPAYLGALLSSGTEITVVDLGIALLLTGGPLATSLLALWRAARAGEAQVTPLASPLDASGRPLQPRDGQVLEHLLDVELRRRARERGTTPPPPPPPDPPRPPAARAPARDTTPEPRWSAIDDPDRRYEDYSARRLLDDAAARQGRAARRRARTGE